MNGEPQEPSDEAPAPLIGKWIAYRWQREEPRRGWFVGKVHSVAGEADGQEANYRTNYNSRITNERSIAGLTAAELLTSEHGTRWVLLEKRGR